jgi:fused signal recognition particle receptor
MSSDDPVPASYLHRFLVGLSRTRQTLAKKITDVFSSPVLDASTLEALEELLITADLGPATVKQIVAPLRHKLSRRELHDPQQVEEALKGTILAILKGSSSSFPDLRPDARPLVYLFLGVNGSGKTTTIGKLAKRLIDQGGSVIVAAADTFRAAAIEQLQIWAERVGADAVCHRAGADPSAVVFDAMQAAVARGATHLLIDTAGRLHTKRNLMEELKKIQRVIARQLPGAPHERFMVLDATTGLNALAQAREFHEAIGLTGLILTKLDGTAKGGVVVAIADQLKLPIAFVGLGEEVDDLQPFSPEVFTDALFTAS